VLLRPLLSSTENYERWNRNGGKDAAARASEISQRTLDEYEEPELDQELKDELKAYVDRRRTELATEMTTVGDVMTRNLLTVEQETTLIEAASAMTGRQVGAVLVVSGGRLTGHPHRTRRAARGRLG